MAKILKNHILLFVLALLGSFLPASFVSAQNAGIQTVSNTFEVRARAIDAARLKTGQRVVQLWGVEAVEGLSISFDLKARTALNTAIGNQAIQCDAKLRDEGFVVAQCVNDNAQDLSLLMLQNGYVSVDREQVYNTSLEKVYIEAESIARDEGVGVWSASLSGLSSQSTQETGLFLLSAGFAMLLVMLSVFAVLALIIMRGFQRIIDAQDHSMVLMQKERQLVSKEQNLIAKMLDSEIKANKSKIEAYLVVYEEMLSSLKDPDRQPKYKKAGDIVQKQPILNRSVFDRNTDKLDMLGDVLASELVHFYARIKTKPDYINLEPETSLDEAISLVQDSVMRAQKLNDISVTLIESFSDSGLSASNIDY